MLLVFWVNKVFNLGHSEFSDSQETLFWMNLISETKTNLGCCEWHSTIVEVKKSSEVDENTLSSLWSKETSLCTSRSN